jgi:hypothetical protein
LILGELFYSGDLSRRQKRLHNSDINLNVNNPSYYNSKRQKPNKYRKSTENSSILSLPSLFSSTTLTNDSTMTLIPNITSSKRVTPDEAALDADDEKDLRDESTHASRHHRYHHQLSTSGHYRFNQSLTSEDDDDDDEELLPRNHHGIIDFMDRVRMKIE